MEWIMLIEMIIKMIQECRENRPINAIIAGMRKPGVLEYLACRKIVKDELGLRGKALRRKAREGISKLRALSRKEVELLVTGDMDAFLGSVA